MQALKNKYCIFFLTPSFSHFYICLPLFEEGRVILKKYRVYHATGYESIFSKTFKITLSAGQIEKLLEIFILYVIKAFTHNNENTGGGYLPW